MSISRGAVLTLVGQVAATMHRQSRVMTAMNIAAIVTIKSGAGRAPRRSSRREMPWTTSSVRPGPSTAMAGSGAVMIYQRRSPANRPNIVTVVIRAMMTGSVTMIPCRWPTLAGALVATATNLDIYYGVMQLWVYGSIVRHLLSPAGALSTLTLVLHKKSRTIAVWICETVTSQAVFSRPENHCNFL
jgi:cytochrome c biogenesis protein CcdA